MHGQYFDGSIDYGCNYTAYYNDTSCVCLCSHEKQIQDIFLIIIIEIKLTVNYFTFYLESAMGCKVNAQTEESDYVKAVHRFVFIEATI